MVESTDKSKWPYDVGDDPSFHAMRTLRGQLTWGICRPDIRNTLIHGDIVAFVSFQDKGRKETEYRFCSIATVDNKVSQTDIWKDESLSIYRKYCNLLIRPSGIEGVWEHFEPCLRASQVHKNWLWRCADHSHLRKKEFEEIQKKDCVTPGTLVLERHVDFACNYVLFSPDPSKTFVHSSPPFVAGRASGQSHEIWNDDELSQEIKCLILDKANEGKRETRWLRTTNLQIPHRHIKFELSEDEASTWRSNVIKTVNGT